MSRAKNADTGVLEINKNTKGGQVSTFDGVVFEPLVLTEERAYRAMAGTK